MQDSLWVRFRLYFRLNGFLLNLGTLYHIAVHLSSTFFHAGRTNFRMECTQGLIVGADAHIGPRRVELFQWLDEWENVIYNPVSPSHSTYHEVP